MATTVDAFSMSLELRVSIMKKKMSLDTHQARPGGDGQVEKAMLDKLACCDSQPHKDPCTSLEILRKSSEFTRTVDIEPKTTTATRERR